MEAAFVYAGYRPGNDEESDEESVDQSDDQSDEEVSTSEPNFQSCADRRSCPLLYPFLNPTLKLTPTSDITHNPNQEPPAMVEEPISMSISR